MLTDKYTSNKGVKKLLKNLNPSEVSSPDNIYPKVLKELNSELVPAVTAIYQQTRVHL